MLKFKFQFLKNRISLPTSIERYCYLCYVIAYLGVNILTTNPAKFIWEDFLFSLNESIGIMKELLKLNDVYVEIKRKYVVREK